VPFIQGRYSTPTHRRGRRGKLSAVCGRTVVAAARIGSMFRGWTCRRSRGPWANHGVAARTGPAGSTAAPASRNADHAADSVRQFRHQHPSGVAARAPAAPTHTTGR